MTLAVALESCEEPADACTSDEDFDSSQRIALDTILNFPEGQWVRSCHVDDNADYQFTKWPTDEISTLCVIVSAFKRLDVHNETIMGNISTQTTAPYLYMTLSPFRISSDSARFFLDTCNVCLSVLSWAPSKHPAFRGAAAITKRSVGF